MNDVFLALAAPIVIVLLTAIYKILDTVWLDRSDCAHTFSRWSDPLKGEGHPYQIRNCNKCNLHESRLIQ